MKRATTIAFLAAMLAPAAVLAQGATAVPLDKATVSKEVAQRTLMKNQISASVARQIVDACVDFARNQAGGPGTYAIFVLAPNGDIVDAHVMDGVLPIGAETGLLKAKTALYARTPSSAVAQRFSDVEGRVIRLDLGKESGLAYYFVGGGLPIVVENNLIGAIRCRRRKHGRAVRVPSAHEGARSTATRCRLVAALRPPVLLAEAPRRARARGRRGTWGNSHV
jgi:uncharacterized protein GlcG (DUF336 family)